MKPEVLLELLEGAAAQLGIRVSYETLQSSVVTRGGGLCRVKGAYRIIIDKRASTEERATTLATAIASLPAGTTADLELPEKVREILRLHEPSGKHRRTAA